MEKGFFGQYSGNARHSRTPVTKKNYRASVADDAAHIHYLKMDIDYDAKHGHSDENMTADEKHISKLAGDMKYDKKHHSPLNTNHPEYTIDPKTGQRIDEFGTPVPKGFQSDMGENYDENEASRMFFDDVRKADRAVSILENVQNQGLTGFGYTTPGALGVLTGGPSTSGNYAKRIQNLRDKVDSDPRQVISTISRNIDRSGSDAAMDVAKEIDPLNRYQDAKTYAGSRFYGRDQKQDPRFTNIIGQTQLEKQKNKS